MKNFTKALLAAAIAGGWLPLFAQVNPVATPAPAPQTNAAPAQSKPAAAKSKKAEPRIETKSEPVVSPEPASAVQNNVNVRGQASLNSEVITRLDRGQQVTVLEEIILKKPKADEPARWYRVSLPTNVAVWVHAMFIDADTKTVKPRRLNLRGGPGENYSIVGRLEKGATINQLDARGNWLKIEPPTNSYGFVAAHLLERMPMTTIAAARPATSPTAETTPVPPPATIEPVPTTTPPVVAAPTPAPAETATPATTPAPAVAPAPVETTPAPVETVRKVVSREGVLKGSVSIQAPTYFALRSLDTGKTINYVHSPSTNLNLQEFKGQRVIVTGEEMLDERWQHTPVLVVESLQTVP